MSDVSVVQIRQVPPALPNTVEGLEALRTAKKRLTLIDYVLRLHFKLWPQEDYRNFGDAVFDEQAITGRMDFDDLRCADMILALAKEEGEMAVMNEKPAAVVHALKYVRNRYNIGRKQRRRQALQQAPEALPNID
jgi:hypothetical protein